MRIDDAGFGRMQRRRARELRLERVHRGALQPLELDAVAVPVRRETLQRRQLRLSAATISLPQRRCAMPRSRQKAYRRSRPATHSRALSEPRRIVESGVDHLAVAGARAAAEARGRLEDQRLAAARGELARDREPDHAGADHHRVDAVHRASECSATSARRHAAAIARPWRVPPYNAIPARRNQRSRRARRELPPGRRGRRPDDRKSAGQCAEPPRARRD